VLQETFCYGDDLLQRRFVCTQFVEDTFHVETFCMCAILTLHCDCSIKSVSPRNHCAGHLSEDCCPCPRASSRWRRPPPEAGAAPCRGR
jgi:hypothetical protein